MTTVLVAHLDLDHVPAGATVEEVLEISSITTRSEDYDDVWLSLFARRVERVALEQCCSTLGVGEERTLSGSKFVNARGGSTLLGHAIAYANAHRRLVLYDCNDDEVFGESSFRGGAGGSRNAFGSLGRLDAAHKEGDWAVVVRELEQLVEASEEENSSAGEALRHLARPLARYLKTYRRMLQGLTLESRGQPKIGRVSRIGKVCLR